ncbi:MAG: hypothetical protein K2Q12_01480 [Rickettsiales bacterium]|nr:hypothetical protein [Rickettsiales bacterium]
MKILSYRRIVLFGFCWLLSVSFFSAYAATSGRCYRDTTLVAVLLGAAKVKLEIPRHYIAYPRDLMKLQQPFIVLAAQTEDGAAVCKPVLNDLSPEDIQLFLMPAAAPDIKTRLQRLLKEEYPLKVADNDEGFIVYRSPYSTVEDKKTYYYELMVPNNRELGLDGYVICSGESITGARLDRERCTAHEVHGKLFLQYKFVASALPELKKIQQTALNLADKVLADH